MGTTTASSIEDIRAHQRALQYHRRLDSNTRVLAIYQIMFGWKTHKYHYETDKLSNPRK